MSSVPPRILVVLANPLEVPLFVTLAGMLEGYGAVVHFLSTDYTIGRQAWKLGRRAPNVMHTHVPRREPTRHAEGVSLENVCRYVLSHPSLDVHYLTLFDQADRLVRAYGRHFDRVRPDLVMGWNGTVPRVRAAMKLAEARNIPTLYFEQGNFPGTLICDPKGVNYEGSMRDFEVPTRFNRDRIDPWLAHYASPPPSRERAKRFSGRALANALVNFFPRRSPFHDTLHFDHDITVHPTRFLRRLGRYLKLALVRSKVPGEKGVRTLLPVGPKGASSLRSRSGCFGGVGSHKRVLTPFSPERFVFLPLQVHDDTQIIVHSPLIRTMEVLVNEVLEALPEGWPLVVKSHPVDEGRRGYRVIDEMVAGTVHRFLRSGNTLELVKRSSCVVTVNSTVGLEALALGKPVLVLGDAVYAGRGITVDVHDLSELPAKLTEVLSFRPDPDEIKRFLDYYVFEYSWPGDLRRPDPEVLKPLADYVAACAGCKPRETPPRQEARAEKSPAAHVSREREAGPLVSIVMPAYNTARFIGQAIESVLGQSYPHWELLVVDDGSTDDTPVVVTRYTDERIRFMRTENRGPGRARNAALEQAHGEFIALLDSDDVWFPHKLSVQVETLREQDDVGLVYSDVWRINEEGHRLKPYRFSLRRLPIGSCLDRMLVRNGVFCASTVVFRRALLDRVGGFNTALPAGQDWELWQRMSMHTAFGYTARALGAYRIRRFSISEKHEARKRFDTLIIERAFADPEVRSRFSRHTLRRLRREAEAIVLYNTGSLALRAGKLGTATASFLNSVVTRLHDYRQIAMLAVSLAARMPGVQRDGLLEVVRK